MLGPVHVGSLALCSDYAVRKGVRLDRRIQYVPSRIGCVGRHRPQAASLDPLRHRASSQHPRTILFAQCSAPSQLLHPPPIKKGLHGGSFGPHPRTEVKGMSDAVGGFLKPSAIVPRCSEPQRREPAQLHRLVPDPQPLPKPPQRTGKPDRPLTRIEQALRVADLILQGGGFSAIILDMGSVAPEHISRVPLATWFRYRAAAERTQTSFLLLSQHACAGSSAGLVLRLEDGNPTRDETTVFTGLKHQVELTRERFAPSTSNVIPLRRTPQNDRTAAWQSCVTWGAADE